MYKETHNDLYKDKAIAQYRSLITYAKSIKKQHEVVKEKVRKLLRELRKSGVLYEEKK